MSSIVDTFDLSTLRLSSGEAAALDIEVRVEPLEFGGETYTVPDDRAEARIDVTRTVGSGYSLRLRSRPHLDGPCMRCLDNADADVEVDAREIDQPGEGEELESPYLEGTELDVRGWAHDALALALPTQIWCKADCAGLCTVCGENLNHHPDHHHDPEPDPRWAKLSELKLD